MRELHRNDFYYSGHVIGVDMTPEMIRKSRTNAVKNNLDDIVEFRLGEIEYLPVADGIVDVLISNCVLNLSTNKNQVINLALMHHRGITLILRRCTENHSAC